MFDILRLFSAQGVLHDEINTMLTREENDGGRPCYTHRFNVKGEAFRLTYFGLVEETWNPRVGYRWSMAPRAVLDWIAS